MRAIIRLSLAYYGRSHRWVAPLIVFAGTLLFLYSTVPNPVMESYALTSALLFAAAAWAGFGYIDAEHAVHQAIAALHAGGLRRYYIGKLLAGLSLVAVLPSLLAVLYPLAAGKLDRAATGVETAVALLAHATQAGLGFAVAVWFTHKVAARHGHALLGLFLLIAASLAAGSIAELLPDGTGALAHVLPPIRHTMQFLAEWDQARPSAGGWFAGLVWPALYSLLLLAAFIAAMERRRF